MGLKRSFSAWFYIDFGGFRFWYDTEPLRPVHAEYNLKKIMD